MTVNLLLYTLNFSSGTFYLNKKIGILVTFSNLLSWFTLFQSVILDSSHEQDITFQWFTTVHIPN